METASPHTLVVDYRERGLPRHTHAVCNLEVGDFRINQADGSPVVIIERKSVADLIASIKDGRYREQKARLLALGAPLSVYAVEGELTWGPHGSPEQEAVRTAILRMSMGKRIMVARTYNPADTLHLAEGMLRRINDGRLETEAEFKSPMPYAHSVKVRKSANMDDPRTVAVLQLCAVPRVSAKAAEAVMGALGVGSMAALCAHLCNLGEAGAIGVMSGIRPCGRRLGEALARRIYVALVGSSSVPRGTTTG